MFKGKSPREYVQENISRLYVQGDISKGVCLIGYVQWCMSKRIISSVYVQGDMSKGVCPRDYVQGYKSIEYVQVDMSKCVCSR